MIKKVKNYIRKTYGIIYPIAALVLCISVWLLAAHIIGSEIIIPSINDTFTSFFDLLSIKKTYILFGNTILRTLITFSFATVLGISMGIISAVVPPLGKFFSPIMKVLRAVPTISVILLIIVWLDSKIAPIPIAFLIIFPIIYSNIFDTVNGINPDVIRMCKIYNVSKINIAKKVYFPYVLPSFFDTAKATVSLALKVVISAEVMAQTKNSIGIMMQISKANLETASLLAWTIFAIVASYLLELNVLILKKIVIRWQR